MLPDRVSNPGPVTYESGAPPIALRLPATDLKRIHRGGGLSCSQNTDQLKGYKPPSPKYSWYGNATLSGTFLVYRVNDVTCTDQRVITHVVIRFL